jgi:hypothetical protein
MQDERQKLGYTLCSSSTGKWCVLRAHCGTAKTLSHDILSFINHTTTIERSVPWRVRACVRVRNNHCRVVSFYDGKLYQTAVLSSNHAALGSFPPCRLPTVLFFRQTRDDIYAVVVVVVVDNCALLNLRRLSCRERECEFQSTQCMQHLGYSSA